MSSQKSVPAKSTSNKKTNKPKGETVQLFERLKRGSDTHENTLKKSIIVASLKTKYNYRPEAISELSGISQAHIYNMLKINAMPKIVKSFIQEGRIGASDALHIARNQRNDEKFIKDVEKYIAKKESDANRTAHSLSFIKKEQLFNHNKITPAKRDKFKNKLEDLIADFSPNRVPAVKLRACTNIITQLIAG